MRTYQCPGTWRGGRYLGQVPGRDCKLLIILSVAVPMVVQGGRMDLGRCRLFLLGMVYCAWAIALVNHQSAQRPHVFHTGSSCLLRWHDYIATCTGAWALNVCAFIITCLRPRHIQHPLYYCTFIWGTSNICVWGGTASGHRVMEVSNTLHKSRFEREITRRLTGQETSIKYIELLVVKSSFSTFHVFLLLCSKSPMFRQTQIFKNGVTDPGISPKLQVNQGQSVVRMNPKWWKY